MLRYILCVFMYFLSTSVLGSDHFPVTTGLEELLKTEEQLIENLKNFAAAEDDILNFLEK